MVRASGLAGKTRIRISMGLALLTMLIGCGGNDEDTSAERATVPSCESRGINRVEGEQGTCVRDGVKYTVVDRDQTLKLEELDATLIGVDTARTLRIKKNELARAKGRYVILTLRVKNKLDMPARFGGPGFGQVLLGDGSRQFTEESSAVHREDTFSTRGGIPPGETETAKMILETPAAFARELEERKASLAIANFKDAGAVEATNRLGIIRLWK
jgi:hypothetical protein